MDFIKYKGKEIPLKRYLGGFAWPGEKPGYAVVIGETLYPPGDNRDLHYLVMGEFEDHDINNLITRCTNTVIVNQNLQFCGRYDSVNYKYLDMWNHKMRKPGELEFDLLSAENSQPDGSIQYHINVLLDRLGKGTLHFAREDCKLKGYLNEVQTTGIASATDIEFPAVAALGYAVVTLIENPPEDDEDEDDINTQREVAYAW